jgi:hypothetical protein
MSREFDLGKSIAIAGVAAFISAQTIRQVLAGYVCLPDQQDTTNSYPLCIDGNGSNSIRNNNGTVSADIVTGDSSINPLGDTEAEQELWLKYNCRIPNGIAVGSRNECV